MDDQLIQQVQHFNFLGCDIACGHDNDTSNKLRKIQMLFGTIHRTLVNITWKHRRIKFYKVIAMPALMYNSKTWTMAKSDNQRILSAKMKFLEQCQKEGIISNELDMNSLNEKIQQERL